MKVKNLLICDEGCVKEITVDCMDHDNSMVRTAKMLNCRLTGGTSTLVITNVFGGRAATNMMTVSEFQSCGTSSSGETDDAEEFCIRGGSIQNVLVQGDQMSFTTPSVPLEVHIEGDAYEGKLPGSSYKTRYSVKDSKTSSSCLENQNQNCSVSASISVSQSSHLNASNSTISDTSGVDVYPLSKIMVKNAQTCPTSTEMSCISESTGCHATLQEQETVSEKCVNIPTHIIDKMSKQPCPINTSPGSVVPNVARDTIITRNRSCTSRVFPQLQQLLKNSSSSSLTHNLSSNKSIESNITNKQSAGIVHSILTGVGERETSSNPLACYVCGSLKSRHQTLKVHLRSHFGYDPFQCSECRMVFCSPEQLEHHVLKHQNIKSFVCIHCGKSFILQRNLDVHLQFHVEHSLKDRVCCVCDLKFESYSSLVNHLTTHTDCQSLTCKDCGIQLPTGIDLLIHTRSHDHSQMHQDASSSSEICLKKFAPESNRRARHALHSTDDKDDVTVSATSSKPNSPVSYSTQRTPQKTKPVRSTGKSHSCNVCGKTFQRATDLVAHRFQHVGEKDKDRKYECEECGSRFKKSWHLKEHERGHTGVKYYACSVCGEKFKRSNQMTKHKKQHFTASNG